MVHFPMDTASLVLGRPSVVTIHDLISDVHYPARWPGTVSRLKAWYLFRLKRASARRAGCVIAPSQATAHDIARHYEVSSPRVTVVPEAAHRMFSANGSTNDDRTRATGEPPYVLSVVSLSPHKNVITLLDAFARGRLTRANDLSETTKLVMLMAQHMEDNYHGRYYAKAQNLSRKLRDEYDARLRDYDLLIMPTLPLKATRIPAADCPREETVARALEMINNTCPFDVTGHPSMTVPCAMSDGLPVGMMLTGRHFDESTVLRAAHAFEQANK